MDDVRAEENRVFPSRVCARFVQNSPKVFIFSIAIANLANGKSQAPSGKRYHLTSEAVLGLLQIMTWDSWTTVGLSVFHQEQHDASEQTAWGRG